MKKTIILIIALILFTSCSSRKALTAEEFLAKADKMNYGAVDVTKEQIKKNAEIEHMYVITSSDIKNFIEFIVFDDIKKAEDFYKVFQSIFDEKKDKIISAKEYKENNYARTNIISEDKYFVFIYLENTAIYAITEADNITSLDKDLKAFGY